MSTQTYVYDTVEVKLTGRYASKPSTLTAGKSIDVYEIAPIDPEAIQFKKWVKMEDLYVLQHMTGVPK